MCFLRHPKEELLGEIPFIVIHGGPKAVDLSAR